MSTLSLSPKVLQRPLQISSPMDRVVILRWAYRQIYINLDDLKFSVDLVVLPMLDFYVSLVWIDYQIDCFSKPFSITGSEGIYCGNSQIEYFFRALLHSY